MGQGQGRSSNSSSRDVAGSPDDLDRVIAGQREFLVEAIDVDFGLLDRLLASGILTSREVRDVRKHQSTDERCARLLDIVVERKQIEGFLQVLVDLKQEHVVNYIQRNGQYQPEFGGRWPLTKRHLATLNVNQPELIDLIDTGDLVNKLVSKEVINIRQMQFICKKATSYEKNEALLEMLRRRSLSSYHKTVECLVDTNQSHVASLLGLGGVLVQVDVGVEVEGGVDVDETEDVIATKLTNLLRNRSAAERRAIYELVEQKLSGARVGHSVALYFLCLRRSELERIQALVESGRLQEMVATVFSRLVPTSIRIRLRWNSASFVRYRQYFEAVDGSLQEQQNDFSTYKTNLNDLPLEMLDSILQKVHLHSILGDHHHHQQQSRDLLRDGEVIARLASVSFCWQQRVSRRKFKKSIWRRLTGHYDRTTRRAAVYRSNQKYLEETIDGETTASLISQLKSVDCLTDAQAALVYRTNPITGDRKTTSGLGRISSDLINVARQLKHAEDSEFVCCLRRSKRKQAAAKVIDNGGVVVKVEIRIPDAVERKSLVDRINDLLDRHKVRTHETEDLLSQLKDNHLEILGSVFDREAVVWVWCQSEDAVKTLQTRDQFVRLLEALSRKSSATTRRTDLGKMTNIDGDQTKLNVVLLPAIVELTTRLDVSGNEDVWGVTKLNKEIWILCRPPHVPSSSSSSSSSSLILAFDGQSPFQFRKKIELREVNEPWDLGSSEMENCLYITDMREKCLWKVSDGEPRQEVRKWLSTGVDWPFTLSVSGGEVCMAVRGESSSSLKIYGPDADLRMTVQLPEDIREPRHAIETSAGRWVVLHEWRHEEKTGPGRRGRSEKLWVMSEVSRDGQMVIRRFVPKDTPQRLTDPKYLAITPDDLLVVLDEGSGRGILFDSSLTWNCSIIPTHREEVGKSIHRPSKVCYHDDSRQLIVVGRFRGGASLYTFSRT